MNLLRENKLCPGFYPFILTFILSTSSGFFLGSVIFKYKSFSYDNSTDKYQSMYLSLPVENHTVYTNDLNEVYNITSPTKNATIAKELAHRIRIFCVIIGSGGDVTENDFRLLWGKRCTKLMIWIVKIGVPPPSSKKDDWDHWVTWENYLSAFAYLYDHHLGEVDWFLVATKTSYVIMENLRYLLSSFDPHKPLYFKSSISPSIVVISEPGLVRFAESGLYDDRCRNLTRPYNIVLKLAICFYHSEVISVKTEIHNNTNRLFFSDGIAESMFPTLDDSLMQYTAHLSKMDKIPPRCSPYAISFEIDRYWQYTIDYMIYKLRPFGISQ